MVEKNTINLLGKIEEQKKNDLIIFTTYTFDPIFFDAYLLKNLKQNNPGVDIIVLMDYKLFLGLEDSTAVTGKDYVLVPIKTRKVFHSKIFMFISESKKQIFLGSHNLTLSGLAQNLELCFSSDDNILFENCINYINSLLKKDHNLDPEHPVWKKIEKYVNGNVTEHRLLHNENEAILDQCLRKVSKQLNVIEEVIIFSPFFSETEKLIEKIMRLDPKKIKLCIQRKNHDLDPTTVSSFNNLSCYEVCNKRTLHSKFIAFRSSDKNLILIGSPNFTKPALLETSKDGNFESAILFEPNSNNFIDLEIKPIADNEIINSKKYQRIRNSQPSQPYTIFIKQAYFDDSDNLHVYYNSKTKKTCRLVGEYQNVKDQIQNKISPNELIELEEGLKSIPIPSMPREITKVHFTENDQTVSNLINVFAPTTLRIRTSVDLTDIQAIKKNLDNIKGIEDILLILNSFSDVPNEQISNTIEKNNSKTSERIGGRRTSAKSDSSIYKKIMNGIKKIPTKPKTTSPSEQKPSSEKNVKQPEKSYLIDKFMPDFYSVFLTAVMTHPECSMRYEIFLKILFKVFFPQFKQGMERGRETERIIRKLSEIIFEELGGKEVDGEVEQNYFKEKLSNIDRKKILYYLKLLTEQYHKNMSNPDGTKKKFTFDASHLGILYAFNPMIAETAETYCIEQGIPGQIKKWLKKHPELMNKINGQAQFDVDEQELDAFKAELRELSDSI